MKIKRYNTVTKGLADLREQTLTFKRNIQARLTHPELFNTWLDSCTGIVYKKNSTKFKLIPRCKELINIDKDFTGYFLSCDYSKLKGIELDSKKGKYDELLTKAEALKHPAWLKLLGKPLLKKYVDYVFKEKTKAMAFWIVNKLKENQLRALCVSGIGGGSNADGSYSLDGGGSFLRVAQEGAKHDKIKQYNGTFKDLDRVIKDIVNWINKHGGKV